MNIMSFFIFFCLIFAEVDEEMEEAVEKRSLPCAFGADCTYYAVCRPILFVYSSDLDLFTLCIDASAT